MAFVALWLLITNAVADQWHFREWGEFRPFAPLLVVTVALLLVTLGSRYRVAKGSFVAQVFLFACTALVSAACIGVLMHSVAALKPRFVELPPGLYHTVPF